MNIQYLVVHHTAVSRNKNPDQFNATNIYHRDKNWGTVLNPAKAPISKLGYYVQYHYEISAAGKVRQARMEDEIGWHVGNFNDRALGICLDLNGDVELPTPEQTGALKELLIKLKGRYPNAKIVPHRILLPNKSCYGKLLSDSWAADLIKPNISTMFTNLKREKGRPEVYAVINNKNYYIGGDAFTDLLADKQVRWEDIRETEDHIDLQGIIK